ncbi:MAG TPA: hypothetical protein VGH32_13275, partial [Pirellulales bacterium]
MPNRFVSGDRDAVREIQAADLPANGDSQGAIGMAFQKRRRQALLLAPEHDDVARLIARFGVQPLG